MLELSMTRLHEVMIILYSVSVLLYFMDYLQKNRKANRLAFWLLAVVWVLQTIFLFLYMTRTGRFPILTLFEGIYFYAWVLVTLSLAINRLMRVDFTVFFCQRNWIYVYDDSHIRASSSCNKCSC